MQSEREGRARNKAGACGEEASYLMFVSQIKIAPSFNLKLYLYKFGLAFEIYESFYPFFDLWYNEFQFCPNPF